MLLGATARQRGYFQMPFIERMLASTAPVARWHPQLWNLLMLELWFQMFIDTRPTAPPQPPAPVMDESLVDVIG